MKCPKCRASVIRDDEWGLSGKVIAAACRMCGWRGEIIEDLRIVLNDAKPAEAKPTPLALPRQQPIDPRRRQMAATAKNTLVDLNTHLFAQLDRLSDASVTGDKLAEEMERSRAIGGLAKQIIDNARLALEAQKALGDGAKDVPEMLRIDNKGA